MRCFGRYRTVWLITGTPDRVSSCPLSSPAAGSRTPEPTIHISEAVQLERCAAIAGECVARELPRVQREHARGPIQDLALVVLGDASVARPMSPKRILNDCE